jgi:heavy metal translocating P-type ATPase
VKRRLAGLAVPAGALAFLAVGLGLRSSDIPTGDLVWTVGLVLTGSPVVLRTLRGLLRGQFAADVVASLAIVTALLVGSPFPGLIVVLMQTGGEALERHAEGRASNAVRELEAAAPTRAHRVEGDTTRDIPVDQIVPGDLLVVRPGELVPCDGSVISGQSAVDAARLTGEPVPVDARPGTRLMSGSVNGASPLTIRAVARASESQYARIVELVRNAQASKAPFQRMADRYAVWFTPATLLVCAGAYAVSSDWQRVLAVLVVATPCPLILATPVAIIGGINRAARRMIIFRTGGSLEALGGVTAAVFDKTGTLTIGRPQVERILPAHGADPREVLRLAAAVETSSNHPMARTLVEAALQQQLLLPEASGVTETPGQGVSGIVEGQRLVVGGRHWVADQFPSEAAALAKLSGDGRRTLAWIVIGGRAAAVVEYQDRLRPGVATLVARIRALGLSPLILLSGDHEANAESVAQATGLDQAEGDLDPGDKADRVRGLQRLGHRVVMLGDGTNDAPALSIAEVGVALASGGGGISAEAADVVLLGDDPASLVDAIEISRDTLRIARQSVWVGLGLSVGAMGFAAAGMITPVAGALLQEAIDVAVILNALRASRPPRTRNPFS